MKDDYLSCYGGGCKHCESENTDDVSESSLNDLLPAGATRWQITRCRKCKSYNGYWVEDARGDAEYVCLSCGHSWWVDGPDY